MSYLVTVGARFEAAHHLLHYRGQPEPLHGHSYRVEVVFEVPALDADELAIDFADAKTAVEAAARELDYSDINTHPAFAGRNTSAENVARHFAQRCAAAAEASNAKVAEVTVWEGPENRATYRAE